MRELLSSRKTKTSNTVSGSSSIANKDQNCAEVKRNTSDKMGPIVISRKRKSNSNHSSQKVKSARKQDKNSVSTREKELRLRLRLLKRKRESAQKHDNKVRDSSITDKDDSDELQDADADLGRLLRE